MSVFNGSLNVRQYTNKYKTEKLEKIEAGKSTIDLALLAYLPAEQSFEYCYLGSITRGYSTGPGYDLLFENVACRNYRVFCTETQLFFVRGYGFVYAKDLDWEDSFIDFEDQHCKLIRKKKINIANDVFNVDVKYMNNYFCNGILTSNEYF